MFYYLSTFGVLVGVFEIHNGNFNGRLLRKFPQSILIITYFLIFSYFKENKVSTLKLHLKTFYSF